MSREEKSNTSQIVCCNVEQWRALEITFVSAVRYERPFYDAQLDVVFTASDGTKITMPAFWDGGQTWRVRFAPTKIGLWTFTTLCTNAADEGLHGQEGKMECITYAGEMDLYKHGFIKTEPGVRYFMHRDGTPFFYLGDTHWVMPHEKFDTSNVPGIASQFRTMVDKRVAQGFTVYQSEPIQTSHGGDDEAIYALQDGFSENTLPGFWNLDRKFKYVADAGLVHANSQLFFASELDKYNQQYNDRYLELLCRYWVARYGAYPLLWTTAQEVDKRGPHRWKDVMVYTDRFDPYIHPATAHQENASIVAASESVYRDMPQHTWYSPQWKEFTRYRNIMYDFGVPRDYWENGQGKPVVNYEGCYEGFYTDRQGARIQGWLAYLSGMFGHGYGAAGIWNDIYEKDDYGAGYLITGTNPGVNFEKYFKTWDQGLAMEGGADMGRMHSFFRQLAWWKLIPRFDDRSWSNMAPGWNPPAWYALATIESRVYVCYFYQTTLATGYLLRMEQSEYSARWFDPATAEYTDIGEIKPDCNGKWLIPNKPDQGDWVLYVVKK